MLFLRLKDVPALDPDRSDAELRCVAEELAEDINHCSRTIFTYTNQLWMTRAARCLGWEQTFIKLGEGFIQKRQRIHEILNQYLVIYNAQTTKTVQEIKQECVLVCSTCVFLLTKISAWKFSLMRSRTRAMNLKEFKT